MRNKQRSTLKKIIVAGKIVWFVLLVTALFAACKQKPQKVVKEQSKAYYTCSMHPQVHEDHDGNCPICGMKLIRVELTGANAGTADDKIKLTASQIQLAGIQTDTIREENVGTEKILTGTVAADENKAGELSARIGGRIQQLFIRTIGEKIAAGQPVYSIYSEEIQEAEKEYLLARQQQKVLNNPDVDYAQLINAAESKLQLWGITKAQIKRLASSGKVSSTIVIQSRAGGTVSEIAVHEGDYVTEGMTILKIQALGSLWVEAQLYAAESGAVKAGDPVSVSFPDLGGQVIKGNVEFVNPELSDASKIDLVRISIPNQQGIIRPGMLANIALASGLKHALAVPASAILTDGKGSKVWLRNHDGSFSARMVQIGPGNQSYNSIISGLIAGDVVVTNGAYLLNSEAIFKNGNDQMGGMKM